MDLSSRFVHLLELFEYMNIDVSLKYYGEAQVADFELETKILLELKLDFRWIHH